MSGRGHDHSLVHVQLTRRLRLWQRRRGHRSSTDDIVCAWAGYLAAPAATSVLDLGSGHGAVTLMLSQVLPAARITAVEAQAASHALLVRNVEENALGSRVTPIHADLRTVDLGPPGPFDLVTGTPPFMPLGSGSLPRDAQRAAARFEMRGGIEAYLAAARRHLASDGVVSLVMDGAQDERCRRAVAGAGLRLVRRVLVAPRAGAPSRFIVYQARATPAHTLDDLHLAIRAPDGGWTSGYESVRRLLDLP